MILYTEEGGVTATIWTDVIQMFVYLAGALVCLVAVARLLPAASPGALAAAAAAGKLQSLDARFDLTQPYTLWAGVVGGMFLTLATHGTDHYLVQRLLVARSRRDASIGLVLSGFLVLAQFVLFLFLGTLLWAHYGGPHLRRAATRCCRPSSPPSSRAAGRASSWPRSWRPRCRPRSTRWPRPRCATSTCPTFDPSADEARADARWPRASPSSGASPQIGVALLAQNVDSALNAAWPPSATPRARRSAPSCSAC